MRRGIALLWQASSLVLAGVLYFLFVLPRWFELTGQWPVALGTVMRIVCGVLLALTALPVLLNLLRIRKPELGTPMLALSLRVWSVIGHVLAGALIVGAGIAEIWLDLDDAGQWLFAIYGAAAAIALLAAFAFYLSFVAEEPPPPPKPLKPKTERQSRRGRGRGKDADEADASTESTETAETAEEADDTGEPDTAEPSDAAEGAEEFSAPEQPDAADTSEEDASDEGKLRNRRPSGKIRRRRSRGGVATED